MSDKADPAPLKAPVSTQEQYAIDTGLTLKTVRGQVQRGYLPTIKIGRYNLINMVKLSQLCMGEDAQSTKE
ncbi:DNA-binding protein [Microbulbifer sp. GL-2]|uniref:DNA-binding protein n=1 Tax=Microbulbifer sp. GL-2 TaxID=2591606 RepID=UPI0011629B7B|nr:DNA-binding protein [Microbulbifer sp. GL-2]BBM04193.1 hypothetical protein GL2_42670 [Microbulbifer sp. GL-2]